MIYIVEDDESIRELVLYALNGNDYHTRGFENGDDFFECMNKDPYLPSLVLLDIMLPGMDGLTILKRLRQKTQWQQIPVIMISAKGTDLDKVKGLDLGADDYVTKPFSIMELMSRVNAILRRTKGTGAKVLNYNEIEIDDERHQVTANGRNIHLTLKEYDLLYCLIQNQDLAMTREKLVELVWGFEFEGESRTVDMHIKTLRQKLGDSGKYIKTIRGVGYKVGE